VTDETPTRAPPPAPAPTAGTGARRRRIPLALIAISSFLAFLGVAAVWINRQALSTDGWTDTSSQMLENDAIRGQVGAFMVDQLYANVDVAARLRRALPPRARPLAAPAAGGLRDLAERGTVELLGRPRAQAVWKDANRAAHQELLRVINGGGATVSTQGGVVTLQLEPLLTQVAQRVGVGAGLVSKLPPQAAQITVLRSDQLGQAQDAARLLRRLPVVLVGLALALDAGAIALARGWRREALRATGIGLVAAGAAALVARSLGGDAAVNALATTEAVRPAATAVWSIGSSLLHEAAWATIAYGVVAVGAAWLAGPTRVAVGLRAALAPYLREPRLAYGGLAAILALLLLWGPTPATRNVVPALVLIALLALGTALLRRQTAREYPDASREESRRRIREGLERFVRRVRETGGRVRATPSGTGSAPAARAAEATARLDQLERLGRLRDSGVLDIREFEREKARILGDGQPTAIAGRGGA
jgi:hypothetical protein